MGFNTSMIVLNDAIGSIEKDTEFGKNVAKAITMISGRYPNGIDISSGCNVNAATVIETHHADFTTLIAFGGNCGIELGSIMGWRHGDEEKLRLLQDAASKLGYKLIKKGAK